MRHITTDKLNKGRQYLVGITDTCYYAVQQHGQKTWVASCITHNLLDRQFFTGNSYAILNEIKNSGGDSFSIYEASTMIDFRRGVMAVLVGMKPDAGVSATTVDENNITIEVTR